MPVPTQIKVDGTSLRIFVWEHDLAGIRPQTANARMVRDQAQWQKWANELRSAGMVNYYNFGSGNKFLDKVTINVYNGVPVPQEHGQGHQAVCWDRGGGKSEIFINSFPNEEAYKFVGALSHELGHAHHNFVGFFPGPSCGPFNEDFQNIWACLFSQNRTTFNANLAPWKQANGVESPVEQYANMFRALAGTLETRGKSGVAPDLVLPGFHDPLAPENADWLYLAWMGPEAVAMMRVYGYRAGSAQWHRQQRSLTFTTGAGVNVAITAPNEWWESKWNWTTWRWEWVRAYNFQYSL